MQVLVSRGSVVLPIWHIFRFPLTLCPPPLPFSELIACRKKLEKAAKRRMKTKKTKSNRDEVRRQVEEDTAAEGAERDRWLVRIHVIAVNGGRAANTHGSGVDTSQCTGGVREGVRRREEASSQSLKDLQRQTELRISPL